MIRAIPRGRALLVLVLVLSLCCTFVAAQKTVHVRTYTRKDGTVVKAHDRAAPGEGSSSPSSSSPSTSSGSSSTTSVQETTSYPIPTIRYPTERARSTNVERNSNGKIKRSESAKLAFQRQTPCPATGIAIGWKCPGYVIDHIIPLACGGLDDPSNMQWQTKEEAKAKDKWERKGCEKRGPLYSITNIKKVGTKPISDKSEGWPLFIDDGTARPDLRFESGTYPVEYVFTLIHPVESQGLSFEDQDIRIEFAISQNEVFFTLENKTEEPIMINWNQVSFIDISRYSQRVTHEGVTYADRNDSLPATTVPPTAKLQDRIIPTNLISSDSRSSGGWVTNKLFPDGPESRRYEDQKVSIFMPVTVRGSLKNYLFTFAVKVR
jgi:hypothetical protein